MDAQDALAVEEPVRDQDSSRSPEPEAGDPKVPLNGTVGGDSAPAGETEPAPEQHIEAATTLRQAVPLFRRPFTPEAIKFKVQNAFGDKGCNVVAYIDARLVVERLNLVFGGEWQEEFEPLASGLMLCRLTVGGVTHTDVGEHANKKGAYSDALKRAAVKFGIGVSVYAIPRAELWRSDHEPEFVKYRLNGQKHVYTLTAKGEETLRRRYEIWLQGPGANFGSPIDHGDVAESAGELPETGESPQATDLPDVAMPMTDAEADDLRRDARNLYAQIAKRKGGRSRLPAARFETELTQASVSHEALRSYTEGLRTLETELRS